MAACVYFVGSGSGDPELLTVKGRRLIERAQVIVYDRLVNPLILRLSALNARLIDVGKRPDSHTFSQDEINHLLVDLSQDYDHIVRLKGGDPSIFGRLGEELEQVRQAGIQYQIIPGITAASGAAAYSDFPLTERQWSSRVTLMTGQRQAGAHPQFAGLEDNGTLCLYMGVRQARLLQEEFLAQGMDPGTPVAIVQWGTWGRQVNCRADLATFPQVLEEADIHNPAMIIIGQVVQMKEGPSWFEKLPGFNQRILLISSIPRSFDEVIDFVEEGADISYVDIGPDRDKRFDRMDKAMIRRGNFDSIIYLDDRARVYYQEFIQHL